MNTPHDSKSLRPSRRDRGPWSRRPFPELGAWVPLRVHELATPSTQSDPHPDSVPSSMVLPSQAAPQCTHEISKRPQRLVLKEERRFLTSPSSVKMESALRGSKCLINKLFK